MPPIPTVHTNGPAIKKYRGMRKLSLTACAEKAGVALSALHYYEYETKDPSLRILVKIAVALDVDVQKICRDVLTPEQLAEVASLTESIQHRQAS